MTTFLKGNWCDSAWETPLRLWIKIIHRQDSSCLPVQEVKGQKSKLLDKALVRTLSCCIYGDRHYYSYSGKVSDHGPNVECWRKEAYEESENNISSYCFGGHQFSIKAIPFDRLPKDTWRAPLDPLFLEVPSPMEMKVSFREMAERCRLHLKGNWGTVLGEIHRFKERKDLSSKMKGSNQELYEITGKQWIYVHKTVMFRWVLGPRC